MKKKHLWLVTNGVGLCAGLVASLVTVILMGILYFVIGAPTPVELFGDYVLKHIDVYTFIWLLLTFEPNSKTIPLGLALLSMIGIGTLLGPLYAVLVRIALPTNSYQPGRREWVTALSLAGGMTLIGTVLFWDELRQNSFGFPIMWASLITALALLIDFCAYGVTLCLTYRALLPEQIEAGETGTVQSRRQMISRVGIVALGIGAGAGIAGLIRAYLNSYATYDGMKTVAHDNRTLPITPNHEHYIVTSNTVDPAPITNLWRLEVTGLIKQPGTYTYDEFRRLPSTSRAITLECIANGVGGRLMGTAIWQGVTLRELLELHGNVLAQTSHVAFHCVDGYTVSLPLDEVLEVDTMLAWGMNGEQLPVRHGYPVRVIIPGRFGEISPKWLTRVELIDHFVHGLYSSQGWFNGPLHTTSRIDYPQGQIASGQKIEVGGIAFAGARGIEKVVVSTDGGANWQVAELEPAISEQAWRFWKWQWEPTRPGRYQLVVRATDGRGELQISREQGTVPNGATGYHKVTIMVV